MHRLAQRINPAISGIVMRIPTIIRMCRDESGRTRPPLFFILLFFGVFQDNLKTG